jgi:uncharacterized protein YndB with AHSA1/START domain
MQTKYKTTYRTAINAPVTKVWEALTVPKIVKQYFFGSDMVTDWKVGNPIIFQGEYEGKPYKDKGIVLEYKPNKSLSYSYLSNWSGMEDKPENYLIVSYHVQETPEGTELTISQTNYDEERAKHSEGNWKGVIDDLKKIVE